MVEMKNVIFSVLALVGFCFAQQDSANIDPAALIIAPVISDTSVTGIDWSKMITVKKNKNLKLKIYGTFSDTNYLRLFTLGSLQLPNGKYLKYDSVDVWISIHPIQYYGKTISVNP
jgi:hypothetical protein